MQEDSFFEDDDETKQVKQKPYPRFRHPTKSYGDELLSIISDIVIPVRKLAICSTNEPSSTLENIRQTFKKLTASGGEGVLKSWNNDLKEEIKDGSSTSNSKKVKNSSGNHTCAGLVNATINIPFKSNILQDWKIIPSTSMSKLLEGGHFDTMMNHQHVQVDLICPSSLVKSEKLQDSTITMSDPCLTLHDENLQLSDLDVSFIEKHNVPIFIHYHGGGMTMGLSQKDPYILKLIQKLLQMKKKSYTPSSSKSEKDSQETDECKSSSIEGSTTSSCFIPTPSYFICLSVEYRLAPEYAFPAAVLDGLSVTSAVLEQFPNSYIHVGGISAGSNLSAVTSFESYRRYPGRIKSCVIIDPMLLPECNTTSAFMNKTADGSCPIEFIRWCWRCYLHIDEENSTMKTTTKVVARDLRNDIMPHVIDIQNSKWMIKDELKPFQRLFIPQVDIPPNITTDKEAPQIIIHTSTADVLRDDGLDLIACLQKHHENECESNNNNVPRNFSCFEGNGSHVSSLDFDKETTARLIHAWYNAIYEGESHE